MAEPLHLRFRGSPLLWLRTSGIAMIVVLGVSALTQPEQVLWKVPGWLTCLLYAAYAFAFIRNTAPFPHREPWQKWVLLTQLLLSLPFDGSLSVVSAITIPLVIEKRHRRVWLTGTLVTVSGLLLIRATVNLTRNWSNLPAGTSALEIGAAVAGGTLELMAWHFFAYLAALLIVYFDEDRRRLVQLNAELKGSRVLLMDSGRFAERLRISRELHDAIGHHLISMSLQLEAAEHLPESQLRGQLAQVRFVSRLLLADVREAVSEWRTETSTALPDALRALTNADTVGGGPKVSLDVGDSLPPLSPTITHALFRCTQEALTNALKHAAAENITVRLRHSEHSLDLEIEDDGKGAALLQPGNGLTGMQSRLAEVGGSVEFTTPQGHGFLVKIHAPTGEGPAI